MSIRLNKALRELNIGLQTAVEFLEKKSELGEVKSELSFKLNDEQYKALVEAFKQDAEVRNQAEKIFQKKPKEKKRESESKDYRAETLLEPSSQQQFKQLGKIDLSTFEKKPAKDSVAPDTQKASETIPETDMQAAAVSPIPQEKNETQQPVEMTPSAPLSQNRSRMNSPKRSRKP